MPLKAYTIVYRSRTVNAKDQELILAWVDPIIQKIEEFERQFDQTQPNLNDQVHKTLDQKSLTIIEKRRYHPISVML